MCRMVKSSQFVKNMVSVDKNKSQFCSETNNTVKGPIGSDRCFELFSYTNHCRSMWLLSKNMFSTQLEIKPDLGGLDNQLASLIFG